jgi:hypothetical protein
LRSLPRSAQRLLLRLLLHQPAVAVDMVEAVTVVAVVTVAASVAVTAAVWVVMEWEAAASVWADIRAVDGASV